MSINLEGITVFVTVAEAGSFSRAAEQLALTRSAVGKIIARLEDRLGARLFHRTTRSQSLTGEGQIYYEKCVRALHELEIGESLIESGRMEVSGKLKISMPVLFGRYCVGPALLSLAVQHPKLELDCHFTDRVVDMVNEGYDLAIRFSSSALPANLQSKKIVTQRKIACAAPNYLRRNGTPSSLEELIQHEALVCCQNGQVLPWHYLDDQGEVISPELNWRLQFDDNQMIADAAVRGMGIAYLPYWLIHEHLQSGSLILLFGNVKTPLFQTWAVWPTSQYYPMKLQVAIDTLSEQLKWVADF
ncbi:LysR family transcriptional regulator [Salmonella enterica subsp. enterica serovar Bonariensis]|nr:LysR family transcriptional regulator [Salmonella enterica]EBW7040345.1 LysR family transcriptional regulator [Salmonella enterica subsp. enterica serovar Bonariensis]EDT7938710.1 LysR family transcriptional regulator [Salmonella enterica subsp. enterica serovar Aba]EBY0067080.1 LysR family transcriptional regulator [Salmonella enterica subsp. enterica serovar Bonariensis]ECC5707784.1 LysR family transcriptional regulator [Salmonella enterica]